MSVQGRVYDLGYRPYDGPRGGRAASVRALWVSSMRRAVGLRRTWRQKVVPWTLLAIAVVPAAVFVGVAYITRDTPASGFRFITYREYVGVSTALLLFVGLTAPDLICPDRRQRFLPLVFSRPLTGFDYVLAKVGAVFTIVFLFGLIPQVVLFTGQMLVSDAALDYLRDNAEVLWQAPVAVAVLALYLAMLGTAVSSLTERRVVGATTFLGLLLVSSIVSSILVGPNPHAEPAALLNLAQIPLLVRDLVFLRRIAFDNALSGTSGGGAMAVAIYVAVLAVCAAILAIRYRWVER